MTKINLTCAAIDKIKSILQEENDPELKLRIFVEGGGCSGMQYGFTLDTSIQEDDILIENDSITVLVDPISSQYLENAEIDYVDDISGSSFKIKNPNAQTTCGCGSSFTPY